MLVALILLSIADATMLVLFVLHERKEQEKRELFLKEYRDLHERYKSLVLSPEIQSRVNDLDAYFESIQKSLLDIDKHIVEVDSKD